MQGGCDHPDDADVAVLSVALMTTALVSLLMLYGGKPAVACAAFLSFLPRPELPL